MFQKLLNIKNINITNIKNIFIFCFVVSLVFSRLIVDLFVVFGAIFFILTKIRKNIKINSYIFFFFLTFYTYLVIDSFFSAVPLESLRSTLPYIRFILFIFFIQYYFSDRSSLTALLFSFFFVYFILLIDGILQLQSGFNLFGYEIDSSGRVSSFFGRKLILGSFISKTFVIVIFLIFYLNIKHKYFLYLGTVIISTLLVYISRERSALFIFLLCLFFSFFLVNKKSFIKIVLLVIFQIVALLLLYKDPLQRHYYHTKSQLFDDNKKISFFSERHELHYITALKIFDKFPLIGGGPNSFRYLCDKDPYSVRELIVNKPKNNFYAKEDSYFFYIKNYNPKNKEGIQGDAILLIKKEYFEKNMVKIFNENSMYKFIEKEENNVNIVFYLYVFSPDNLINKINHKNFDLIKKDSLIYTYNEFSNGCNTHPHHLFIQFLAETGIIGTFFLIIFYFFICKSLLARMVKFIKKSIISNDIIIYAYYFSVFMPLVPSGNFFNNYYSLLLYLPLNFIILCRRK